MTVRLGVDVGKQVDPSALAVVEALGAGKDAMYHVRQLQRLNLGTPYPGVAERVLRACANITTKTGSPPDVYVDATGVGGPVVDILRAAITDMQPRPRLVAVTLTHGEDIKPVREMPQNGRRPLRASREWRVGKMYLVSRLKALMQTGRIVGLAPGEETAALQRELQDFELHTSANGYQQTGAFRAGSHDDLVIALGLAVLVEVRSGGNPAAGADERDVARSASWLRVPGRF